MDNKNLLEIYKVEAEKYNKTRDIQWKMNIAFWTVLILAIFNKIKVDTLVLCFFFAIHLLFVIQIQGSLDRSIRRLRFLGEYLIEKEESEKFTVDAMEKTKIKSKGYKRRTFMWHVFQLTITVFLIIILLEQK